MNIKKFASIFYKMALELTRDQALNYLGLPEGADEDTVQKAIDGKRTEIIEQIDPTYGARAEEAQKIREQRIKDEKEGVRLRKIEEEEAKEKGIKLEPIDDLQKKKYLAESFQLERADYPIFHKELHAPQSRALDLVDVAQDKLIGRDFRYLNRLKDSLKTKSKADVVNIFNAPSLLEQLELAVGKTIPDAERTRILALGLEDRNGLLEQGKKAILDYMLTHPQKSQGFQREIDKLSQMPYDQKRHKGLPPGLWHSYISPPMLGKVLGGPKGNEELNFDILSVMQRPDIKEILNLDNDHIAPEGWKVQLDGALPEVSAGQHVFNYLLKQIQEGLVPPISLDPEMAHLLRERAEESKHPSKNRMLAWLDDIISNFEKKRMGIDIVDKAFSPEPFVVSEEDKELTDEQEIEKEQRELKAKIMKTLVTLTGDEIEDFIPYTHESPDYNWNTKRWTENIILSYLYENWPETFEKLQALNYVKPNWSPTVLDTALSTPSLYFPKDKKTVIKPKSVKDQKLEFQKKTIPDISYMTGQELFDLYTYTTPSTIDFVEDWVPGVAEDSKLYEWDVLKFLRQLIMRQLQSKGEDAIIRKLVNKGFASVSWLPKEERMEVKPDQDPQDEEPEEVGFGEWRLDTMPEEEISEREQRREEMKEEGSGEGEEKSIITEKELISPDITEMQLNEMIEQEDLQKGKKPVDKLPEKIKLDYTDAELDRMIEEEEKAGAERRAYNKLIKETLEKIEARKRLKEEAAKSKEETAKAKANAIKAEQAAKEEAAKAEAEKKRLEENIIKKRKFEPA